MINTFFKLGLFALIALSYGCAQTQPMPSSTEDGLNLVKHKTIDELYVRDGFQLQNYNQLNIQAIQLSYSDEMRTKTPGLTDDDFKLSDKEMQRFEERATKGFSTALNKESSDSGNLIVKHSIEDFYLTSPIKISLKTPDKSFVQDSSRFTLTTELIDASTQQVMLRAKDKIKTGKLSSSSSNLTRHSSVTYWQDIYQSFRRWGSKLNNSLK